MCVLGIRSPGPGSRYKGTFSGIVAGCFLDGSTFNSQSQLVEVSTALILKMEETEAQEI